MEVALIVTILKIIMIDIILSGDNAVVIAMATRSLPKELQNKAIAWGTAFAVISRIVLATIVVLIMNIPYIHAAAGALLVFIAWGVLNQGEEEANVKSSSTIGKAIATIAIADITMSLDNVIAVAGVAGGHLWLLITGIAISIPLMIFGSKWLVKMMGKYPIIIYIGAGILAWTAGEMVVGDERLAELLHISEPVGYLITAVITIVIVAGGYFNNKKNPIAISAETPQLEKVVK